MAKALKIVGTVVAVVGLVATAIATGGASLGFSTAVIGTAKTVAAVAMIAGAVLAVVSAIAFKPKFSTEGTPTRFTTNPQSPIPYCIGRTRQSGIRIHADTWNGPWSDKGKNDILGFAVMLSGGGQIDSIEKFTADGTEVTFDSSTGYANSSEYVGWMAQKVHLGGPQTSALALSLGYVPFEGWTTAHKLSGITHALWSLRFDFEGKQYGAGVPEPAWIGRWVKVYDPRLDSTYPGGSGSCRPLQEETYVWSRNPALHALTWALGRWQNGKKVFGIGASLDTIRVADFVEAANVADTNKWHCGGVEYSTESKWTVLKRMLQAGGAIPTTTGAMIGCRVYMPRVSVTTITSDDLLDNMSFSATKPQRDRFNTVIPRYRSEAHEWEVISGSPVTSEEYVLADGRVRQKEYDLALVQHEEDQTDVDGNRQAGQLAAYEIVESREAGPISFTTGPKFLGLKAGDCVNINAPNEGFSNAKVMIIEPPKFDPASGKISFVGQTETDAKHAFALGKTTTPPPPFSLTSPDILPPAPSATDWSVETLLNADGIPVFKVTGGTGGSAFWNGIIVQFKRTTDTEWIEYGTYRDTQNLIVEILVEGETEYHARIAYLGANNVVSDWLITDSIFTPAATINLNSATIILYKRSATVPTGPSGVFFYNFATGILSSGTLNGWSQTFPASDSNSLYAITNFVSSNEPIVAVPASDFTAPVVYNNDSLAYTTAANFNGRNDRNGASIAAPTIAADGTAVDHTINTDGSVDISFEWSWSGSNPDIDYWEIMEVGRTTSDEYVIGSNPSIEQHYYIPAERRVYFARGVASDLYWTYAVRAVRVVDPDINSGGYIYSSWVKPSLAAENPYRPSATVAFAGDISGTVGFAPLPSQPNYTIDLYRRWATGDDFSRTRVFKLSRFKGNTDVSSSATWAVAAQFGLNASVSTTGLVTITAQASADGFATVTSTYEGITISHIVSVNSIISPPPITAGRTQTIGPAYGYNSITSSTEVDISSIFTAKTGATGSFNIKWATLISKLNSESANPANFIVTMYLYARPIGGTFTQIDQVSPTTNRYIHDEAPDYALFWQNRDKTGLSANTVYELKITAAKPAGYANGTIIGKGIYFEGY